MKAIVYAVILAVAAVKAASLKYTGLAEYADPAVYALTSLVVAQTAFGLVFFALAVHNNDYETVERFQIVSYMKHALAGIAAMAVGMTAVCWILVAVALVRVAVELKSEAMMEGI